MMDFAKFRETGELSDITVVVDDAEHRLHKFPLFIKSDFFRALARGGSATPAAADRVVLREFPGGGATFQLVADYCYNMRVDITRENVCALRCAAEFLQMNSKLNLADLTDTFLQDTLTSAKLARNMAVIAELLLNCRSLGAIAETAKVVDKCIGAIVDCWLITAKYGKRIEAMHRTTVSRYELSNIKKLADLPLDWFKQLFVTARDRCVRSPLLAAMLEVYINAAMGEPLEPSEGEVNGETPATVNDVIPKGKPSSGGTEEEEEDEEEELLQVPDLEAPASSSDAGSLEEKEKKSSSSSNKREELDPEVSDVLETLVAEMPDTQTMAEALTPAWTVRMLHEADRRRCSCRQRLFQMVARLLPRLLPADLAVLPPELLCELVEDSGGQGGDATGAATASRATHVTAAVDQYLLGLANEKKLSVDVFSKLVKAVPADSRDNHDALFEVLETLLASDNSLKDTDREKLLEEVDFSRLSETLLKRAYDARLVPVDYVTQAALSLCGRLRLELEETRRLVRAQEDELEKYGLGGRGQTWLRRSEADGADSQLDSLYDSNYDPVITPVERAKLMSAVSASVPAYDHHHHHRRSLESLERAAPPPPPPVATSPYTSYSRVEFTSPLHYGSRYLDVDRPLTSSVYDRYTSDIYRRHLMTRWS